MSIKAQMSELDELTKEIKLLSEKITKLRKRKKEIEENIGEYLESNNKPGFKCNGKVVTKFQKESRKRLNKRDKEENMKDILRENGIHDTDNVCNKILESIRGDTQTISTIKIK
jgi:vacuolar-type H+-ATPase subunit I/STV1